MRKALFVLLALFTSAATAQDSPQTLEVRLSSFDFAPRDIRLRAGEPVTLRLINTSGGGHNFSAPAFFASARLIPGADTPIRDGSVELASKQVATVRLIRARNLSPALHPHFSLCAGNARKDRRCLRKAGFSPRPALPPQ